MLNNLPVVAIVSIVPTAGLMLILAALAGWPRRWRELAGTTLRAPWLWTLIAIAALLLGHAAAWGDPDAPWLRHARYLAALATFCPLVAVLGAKRPQDRAWQFIVGSLWVVAALPSMQQWFARPDAVLELHSAWRWFLLILIAIGLFNRLPTRHWPSGLLASVGQCCLFAPHLPLAATWVSNHGSAWEWGVALWMAAIALITWDLPRRRHVSRPLDRLWLDFRDLTGTMWSLRVAERINAAARQHNWGARLGWRGWQLNGPPPSALERSLRMLLRRFVSQEWIDRRLRP